MKDSKILLLILALFTLALSIGCQEDEEAPDYASQFVGQ